MTNPFAETAATDAPASPAPATAPAAEPGAPAPVAAGPVIQPNPAPLPPIPQPLMGDGDDPTDFVRANRIHVKDGSLFVDSYLVIHPRELAPENEAQLRKKLRLTYSITNPSFYETPERMAIAMNLGQLVPVSLAAKRAQLVGQVSEFNRQVKHRGTDINLARDLHDKQAPFNAILRDTVEAKPVDPSGLELLKNGLAMYMLMREKLTLNGYTGPLASYVTRTANIEQVLGDLQQKIGVSGIAVRQAALSGGIDGVGRLLGLDPRYVADTKQLAEYAATQEFGFNLVEHWHLGRQLLGVDASLQQKIAAGLEAHIDNKIREFREQVHHHYDVAVPVQQEEARIAEAMKLLDPVQRKLAYALGYEICFSPEMTADDIAFHKGVYGLHRKSANDLRDIRGTYRVYFSGKGDLEGSMRTLVHEIAHNLWPEQFSPAQVADIDRLAGADQNRFLRLGAVLNHAASFDQFGKLLDAYHAADATQKPAVMAAVNQLFAPVHVSVDAALMEHLKDPYQLRYFVSYANDVLQVEGDRYNKSGYATPEERFREVISRFAELKQVRLRDEPEILDFLAPGLNQVWQRYYLPHLETVYAKVLANSEIDTPIHSVPAAAHKAHGDLADGHVCDGNCQHDAPPAKAAANGQACEADIPNSAIDLDRAPIEHNAMTVSAMSALSALCAK